MSLFSPKSKQMSLSLFFLFNKGMRTSDYEVISVGGHGAVDPGVVVADPGVDSRPVPLGTAVAPGHHTLQLTVAHHGATRVSLIGHRQRTRREQRFDTSNLKKQ